MWESDGFVVEVSGGRPMYEYIDPTRKEEDVRKGRTNNDNV